MVLIQTSIIQEQVSLLLLAITIITRPIINFNLSPMTDSIEMCSVRGEKSGLKFLLVQ